MTDLADELTDADMLLMWQSGPHRDRSTGAGWFPNPLAGAAPQGADSPFDPPADPRPRTDATDEEQEQPLAVLEGRNTSMAARLTGTDRFDGFALFGASVPLSNVPKGMIFTDRCCGRCLPWVPT